MSSSAQLSDGEKENGNDACTLPESNVYHLKVRRLEKRSGRRSAVYPTTPIACPSLNSSPAVWRKACSPSALNDWKSPTFPCRAKIEVLGRETTGDRPTPSRRRNSSAEERIEEEIVQIKVATIPRTEDPQYVQTSTLLLHCSSNRWCSAVAPPSPSKKTLPILVASVRSCSALLLTSADTRFANE